MGKLAIVVCLAAYVAADATADADADAALLYGHSYGAYHPLTYSYHAPYYRAALPYAAYTGFGHRYYANSGGAVHIVKRDADAEPEADADAVADADADAALYGYSYGYHPRVYSGYRYPAYSAYAHPYAYRYGGYPYAYHHFGK